MNLRVFEIVIEKEPEDKGYMAFSPALPGCFGKGWAIEETRQSSRSAIQQYVEMLSARPCPPLLRKERVG